MPISNSYPSGIPIEDADLFVGTKAANNRTVNYTAQGIANYLNVNSKVSIGGQMSFQFTVTPKVPKTISFEGGGGNNTTFSSINKLIVSAIDVSTADITIFLNYLNNSQVLLSEQNQPNFFGHYKITGYTQIGISAFYELDLEFIGGNGTIIDKQYYDLISFVLNTEAPATVWGNITGVIEDQTDLVNYVSSQITTPTLQEVLDAGHDLVSNNNFQGTGAGLNNTGVNINAFGFEAAKNNDGESVNAFGSSAASDNIGININALGINAGLLNEGWHLNAFGENAGIENTFNNVNLLGQNAVADEDGQTVLSKDDTIMARISTANLTVTRKYNLPDASGVVALTSDIGTWGALNYPTWTTGAPFVKMTAVGTFALDTTTYYPYPTGTISQYIRGDGSLDTFPSITIPTLQEVTTAGSTTTDVIVAQNTSGTAATQMGHGFCALFNTITDKITTISADSDLTFQNGANILYLKSPATISGTNTQTLQNASGTIALLSDIPAAGVTSVGLTMPSAFTVTNSPITSSGDIAVTGAGLVSQYVRGDGTLANFPNSTGGGSSVNYYLNGSVSQGTFGGTTYYQMSKTPILGGGTNFIRTNGAGNGYIASFITDAGDPSQLNIPGGNWNVEFYFNASSSGGSPSFYAELYKVSATNVFTLIASDSLNPENITNGTTVDQYFTSIPVPQTTLLVTDRLAVRIFVNTGGRTITLHTENGNLSEVLTTFTTGLTALNGLTDQVQFLAVGTSGTDFAISSATDTHTFDLPTASAVNRGALSSADWTTFNNKQTALGFTPLTFNEVQRTAFLRI